MDWGGNWRVFLAPLEIRELDRDGMGREETRWLVASDQWLVKAVLGGEDRAEHIGGERKPWGTLA